VVGEVKVVRGVYGDFGREHGKGGDGGNQAIGRDFEQPRRIGNAVVHQVQVAPAIDTQANNGLETVADIVQSSRDGPGNRHPPDAVSGLIGDEEGAIAVEGQCVRR